MGTIQTLPMQKTISLLFLSALLIAGCKNTEKQDAAGMAAENYRMYKNSTIPTFWKEPSVFEYGREKARAEFMPFETEPLAIAAQAANSRYFKSLNGFWKYQYFPGPDYVPADVEKSSWTQVTQQTSFPGFMELKGFGNPVFNITTFPFPPGFRKYLPTAILWSCCSKTCRYRTIGRNAKSLPFLKGSVARILSTSMANWPDTTRTAGPSPSSSSVPS